MATAIDPELPADRFEDAAADRIQNLWRVLAALAGLLVAGLLIALIVLVAHSQEARDDAVARQRHSYEVMLATASFGDALTTAEAELGHYVINGDRALGSSVSDEWALAGDRLDRLDAITSDNPDQQRLIAELRQLFAMRAKEFGDPATRAYFRQGNAALNLFNAAGKTSTGPRISDLLRRLSSNERALLEQRTAQAADSIAHSNEMAGWLSGIGIAIGLGAALMGMSAFRSIAERAIERRDLSRVTARTYRLEARVAERTRDLELANLALQAEATERAVAEAQLRQAQKMEAVGKLTGGIAHDFNNMLAVVIGGLDLARKRLRADEEDVGRHIDHAMEGATRAAALTRRLLAFARADPLQPERVETGALLAGMSELLDRALGERVTIETRLAADIWPLWIDPHELENAVVNLCVNARDALDDEGVVVIAAENVRLAADAIGAAAAGDYVCIRVIDDGAGMSRAVLDRAFEPFFTTKPVGKGTGLGLSQIFGFVRQSGGEIAIDTREGIGTTVSLYWPRFQGEAELHPPAEIPAAVPLDDRAAKAVFSGTVLVVEDDPRVRRATIAALDELGRTTLACDGGEAALAQLATRPDVQLIVTDVLMPGMSGPDLVRQVTARYPWIGILFVTGFVGDFGEAVDLSGYVLLRKPFTIAVLATAVEAAEERALSARSHAPGVAAAE